MSSNDFLLAFTKELSENGIIIINSKDIIKGEVIGKGGYGKVLKGVYQGKEVAIKELIADCKLKEAFSEISKEIDFIKKAQNDRLPFFYGLQIDEEEKLGLIFEYIKGYPLNLVSNGMDIKTKLEVVYQLVEILVFLHSKKMIHRDIKPQNIMIEDKKNVRLIDFGVSKIAEKTSTNTANSLGTTAYMAPENFDFDCENDNPKPIIISAKADVWSVGCLISELFSGVSPWNIKNVIRIEKKLMDKAAFPIPNEITCEPVRSLISSCTIIDPLKRPSSQELLELIKQALEKV